MLTKEIRNARNVTDIVGLIPEVRQHRSKKTVVMLFYDKVKEITAYTTDKTEIGILKTNFVDHPTNIDPQKDRDIAIFILRRLIINAESYNQLLMIESEIDKYEDPNLTSFYQETKKTFESNQ